MPKYQVHGCVTGSKYLGEFEADTKEEAEAMALASGEVGVHLCHQCADQCESAEIERAVAWPSEEATNA